MKTIPKQLEALIAKIKKQTESFDTVVLKEDEANALIEALEQAQAQNIELLALREAGKEPVALPGGEDWISHNGKGYPQGLHGDEMIFIITRKQELKLPYPARLVRGWNHFNIDFDIMAYRLAAAPHLPAVPEFVPVPDEYLSAEQNQRGMFELSEDCMVRLASALAQQSKGLVVPPGWVMVPRKITLEMECALSRADSYEIGWQYAIAAAPKPE